jgi:hypothetical protein
MVATYGPVVAAFFADVLFVLALYDFVPDRDAKLAEALVLSELVG